jgi:hypothetical protein
VTAKLQAIRSTPRHRMFLNLEYCRKSLWLVTTHMAKKHMQQWVLPIRFPCLGYCVGFVLQKICEKAL